MEQPKIWLASNSPRRREILSWTGWDIKASAANIDESRRGQEPAQDFVLRLAFEKANHPISGNTSDRVIIAADTIVVLDGEILGKPSDDAQAFEMLNALGGRAHEVMTGLVVRSVASGEVYQDICRTCVEMRPYSEEEIHRYIASGDPTDKAGGYAIQNKEFHPVVNFNGCFSSVMGMPLCHLERILQKAILTEPVGLAQICQNHLKYNCPISSRVMAGEDIG